MGSLFGSQLSSLTLKTKVLHCYDNEPLEIQRPTNSPEVLCKTTTVPELLENVGYTIDRMKVCVSQNVQDHMFTRTVGK
jgi:hypothetical protein